MKHIILTLIALLAMFTFWRFAGGPLTAKEHVPAGAVEAEAPAPVSTAR